MKINTRSLFEAGEWRKMRRILGKNQTEFWGAVKVSQSGGCRYENGREMPEQVHELLRLIYVEGIDVFNLRRSDVSAEGLIHTGD